MIETDNRVDIEIELADEEWYTLMKIAHAQDITLNQLVERVLTEEINRIEKERS